MDGGVLSIRLTIIEGLARSVRESVAQCSLLEARAAVPCVIGPDGINHQAIAAQQLTMVRGQSSAQLQTLLQHSADLIGAFQPKQELKLSE